MIRTAPTLFKHAQRNLREVMPDVEFTFSAARRGRFHIAWTGGPSVEDVRHAAGLTGWHPRGIDLEIITSRGMTEEEFAAAEIVWQREAAEREAQRIADEPRKKAEAAAKRAESLAVTKAAKAILAAPFPGVAFSVKRHARGWVSVEWVDGPALDAVEAHGVGRDWVCHRSTSREAYAAQQAAALAAEQAKAEALEAQRAVARVNRTARRLAASKAKAARVAFALARRSAVEDPWLCASPQGLLPFGDAPAASPVRSRWEAAKRLLPSWVLRAFGAAPDSVQPLPVAVLAAVEAEPASVTWIRERTAKGTRWSLRVTAGTAAGEEIAAVEFDPDRSRAAPWYARAAVAGRSWWVLTGSAERSRRLISEWLLRHCHEFDERFRFAA